MQFIAALLGIVAFTVPACIILSNKHRGAGYYILAFLCPLIGLIVALCLSKLDPVKDNATPPSLDITDDNKQS